MRYLLHLIIFSEAAILSFLFTPLVIRLAMKYNIVDKPGKRKIHEKPKPLLGGMAIFSSFILVVAGNILAFRFLHGEGWVEALVPNVARIYPLVWRALPQLAIILAGGFFIHLLGLIDDVYKERVTYRQKFIFQIVIIAIVAVAGIRTQFMPGRFLDIVITTVWIVGITNSFNLLDNLDGLTAGVAIISAAILFVVAVLQGQIFFAFMLAALAGSCLGFLRYNFHPSKLFMGDSGSLFLGFMFGAITVTGSYVVDSSASLLPIVLPALVLSIPLYDTFSVMFIRKREKRPLFIGDKSHFSHRLLDLGMSHRGTVVFIYLINLCVGGIAVLMPYISVLGSALILAQAVGIYTLITILISVGKNNQKRATVHSNKRR